MDWDQVEQSQEFQELAARRRRVVIPLLIVFVVWYGGFLVLAAYARDFMAETIYRGFTVADAAALSLVLMTWLISFIYLRLACAEWPPAPTFRRCCWRSPGAASTRWGRWSASA